MHPYIRNESILEKGGGLRIEGGKRRAHRCCDRRSQQRNTLLASAVPGGCQEGKYSSPQSSNSTLLLPSATCTLKRKYKCQWEANWMVLWYNRLKS